jgi:transcriptional regulator with XRE-family HTH domain
MVDQDDSWARQWAVTTGRCVRRWRSERKLSAQKLADKCAVLGLPSLTRTVITKLENGRKESVSTAELMVLAKALDVPPVMLMFPFGELRMVEITPGEFIEPLDAAFWVAGQDPDNPARADEKGSALDLFMIHREIVDAMLSQRSMWRTTATPWIPPIRIREFGFDELGELMGKPPLPQEERILKEFQYNATLLRTTRDHIRRFGMEPPPLPPELSRVDDRDEDEEDSDGEHRKAP